MFLDNTNTEIIKLKMMVASGMTMAFEKVVEQLTVLNPILKGKDI